MFTQRASKSLTEIISESFFQQKTDEFDSFMRKTHQRFWNPRDERYVDFSQPFDVSTTPLLPFSDFPELEGPLKYVLDSDEKKIQYVNKYAWRLVTGSLYAEQAAMLGAVTLAKLVDRPEALEYALNQAREEARHMIAFYDYIALRFGAPHPHTKPYQQLLIDIVEAPKLHLQLVGVQILVEGLGMGALSYFIRHANDPVLTRICSLVASDEATHHRFGLDWLRHDLAKLTAAERDEAEDWALYCFKGFEDAVFVSDKLVAFYQDLGFNEADARRYVKKYHLDQPSRYGMIFSKMAHTLLSYGLITDRTRDAWSFWLGTTAHSDALFEEIIADSTRILAGINQAVNDRNVLQ